MAMCALLWISINKLYRGQLGEGERIPVGKPNGSHAIRFCSRSAAAVCREVRNSPCREATPQSCGASVLTLALLWQIYSRKRRT